jgi:enoyl-CoA hydratase/carnithine racemase
VATEPAPAVYLLTITSPPDNRLTTASCTAMLDALDLIEYGGYKPGVLVTTSGIDKFYSNGLDLEHALGTEGFLPGVLYRLFHRLLTYPMPTIALLPGHAFAAGLMLAMHHDYRVMNSGRGFACVNELDFGVPLKPAMSSIFRLKLPPSTYRSLVLEAHRFGGQAALDAGIVDRLGGLDAVLELVKERKLTGKAKTGIYGLLKAEMYRESVALLSAEGYAEGEEAHRRLAESEDKRREEGERRVEALREKAKAKL